MNATILRSSCAFLMLLALSVSSAAPIGVEQLKQKPSENNQGWVAPGIVVVMLKAGTPHTSSGTTLGIPAIDRILARINAHNVNAFHKQTVMYKGEDSPAARLARTFKIEFGSPEDSYALCAELAQIPEIQYAEPYYWFKPHYTPNDPMLDQQWGVGVMNLEAAWEITKGDPNVTIAIIDSGIDYEHPDLAANIWINMGEWGVSGELSNNGIDDDGNGFIDDYRGWDFGSDDNDPMDKGLVAGGSLTFHGTSAAGCASAVTDNGIGIAGAGYNCTLMAIKAGRDGGNGISHGYEGIKYASDMGAKVISCSWGGFGASITNRTIIEYVTANGSLVVSSSGNDPIDNDYQPHFPSSYPGVVAVGSVEKNGSISGWCTYGTTVDIYAPGTGIRTTTGNKGYTNIMGTSFSAPYAAGIAGLIFSVHPDWTPQQVAKQIRITARRGVTNDPKRYGRIDAEAAVSMNTNLEDTPGFVIESIAYPYENGVLFNELAQSSEFTVRLRNILGPSSENTVATIEFDQGFLSSTSGWQTVGAVAHDGTVDVTFNMALADTIFYSEGAYPFRIRIEDGDLVDFLPTTFNIFVTDGWHRQDFNFRPSYTSISMVDGSTIWALSQVGNPPAAEERAWITTDGGDTWRDASADRTTNGWPPERQGIYNITGIDENTALFGLGSSSISITYKTVNQGAYWASTIATAPTTFINFIHMFDDKNGIYQGDPKFGKWGIGVTTNAGDSWSKLPIEVPSEPSEVGWNNGYDAIGDNMWFGTNMSRIYRSTDRGQTWTTHTTPLKNSVGVSFRDANVGIARFSQQDTSGAIPNELSGLALTADGGLTWNLLNTLTVNSGGAVEMERGGKRIFVLNNGNSYVSDDLGQTWNMMAVPTALFVSCTDLHVDQTANMTYMSAGGAYLYGYESPYQQVVSVKPSLSAENFTINAVYPNPASGNSNKGVTVSFTLPNAGAAELQVYDYTGRLVATPVQASLNPGTHSAYVDFGALPAGLYFLKLYHNNAVQVSKVTVAR